MANQPVPAPAGTPPTLANEMKKPKIHVMTQGGSLPREDVVNRVATLIFVVCLSLRALADGMSPKEVIDQFLTTNLVAAVVGYHATREVEAGIRIPLFTSAVSAGETNAYGVLFYVIAPTNYANYYFYLDGEDRFNAGKTTGYYRPDEFYWFRLSEKGPEYDVRRLLFLLPLDPYKRMGLTKPFTSRFFVSKASVEKELERLARSSKENMEDLPKLDDAQKKSITREDRKQSRSHYLTAKAAMISLKFQKKDALRQKDLVKEQWKVLRSSLLPGFALGDTSYWDELKMEEKRMTEDYK